MENDSVDTDAGDNSSVVSTSGVQGQAEAVALVVPSVTSTISGLPISPAYAGAVTGEGPIFKAPRHRTLHFSTAIAAATPSLPRIKSEHAYIPQRRGRAVEKNMIGDGDQVTDPMDNFKPQKFHESESAGNGVEEHKPENPNKFRTAAKKAYRSENASNSEVPTRKQLRHM